MSNKIKENTDNTNSISNINDISSINDTSNINGTSNTVNADIMGNADNVSKEAELSLEEAFGQIEAVIDSLEADDITLEDSFRAYQEGMKLLGYCNGKIDKVEKQVLKINENGELDEF